MRDSGELNRATTADLVLVILFSVAIFGYAHLQTFTNPLLAAFFLLLTETVHH